MGMRSPSPTQRRRAAQVSEQELAESAPFASVVDPKSMPEMKVWLRVDQASDSGTLTIPDAMGGSSAVQAAAPNKPTLGTTTNGLAKLTNTISTGLTLPVSAGLVDTQYFGMSMWVRPTALTGGNFLGAVRTGAGGSTSADRMEWRQSNNDTNCFIWMASPTSGVRRSQTLAAKGFFLSGAWKFVSFEYVASGVTEQEKCSFKDMGTPVATSVAQTFDQAVATAAAMPSQLITCTGSVVLFNRLISGGTPYAQGFIGDIGPDIFFYDPRTMNNLKRIQLAHYRVPT